MASRRVQTDFYIIQSFFAGNMHAAWDGIKHIIMPAIALGTNMMGIIMRVTRLSVLEIMAEDYVRTARARASARAPCSGATCSAMR
jgi:ABC-type dipeptide/oligopeptide/nickel transport system permease component